MATAGQAGVVGCGAACWTPPNACPTHPISLQTSVYVLLPEDALKEPSVMLPVNAPAVCVGGVGSVWVEGPASTGCWQQRRRQLAAGNGCS